MKHKAKTLSLHAAVSILRLLLPSILIWAFAASAGAQITLNPSYARVTGESEGWKLVSVEQRPDSTIVVLEYKKPESLKEQRLIVVDTTWISPSTKFSINYTIKSVGGGIPFNTYLYIKGKNAAPLRIEMYFPKIPYGVDKIDIEMGIIGFNNVQIENPDPNYVDRKGTNEGEPFDASLTMLPPNYAGADTEKLIESLKQFKRTLIKDEFETQAQFLARRQSAVNQPIGNTSLTTGSIIALKAVSYNGRYDYDAETQTMEADLFPSNSQSRSTTGTITEQATAISLYGGGSSSYVSAIAPALSQRLRVLEPRASMPGIQASKPGIQVRFRIAPEEARESKPNLAFLLVGNLEAPFYSEDSSYYQQPSFPTYYYKNIHFAVKEIWLYNVKTGKIYAKLPTR